MTEEPNNAIIKRLRLHKKFFKKYLLHELLHKERK